ncbi:MAG: DUF2219 family protein [Phycisphaerae bacterium]|nr:DUF2219 family protein [Phycisphaerae bacterium]
MNRTDFVATLFVFLLFVCLAGQVIADDAVSLYVENDSRLLKPTGKTDRHYTHGAKLVYLTQPDWQWLHDFSEWDIAGVDQPVDTVVGFFIGQFQVGEVYTYKKLEIGYSQTFFTQEYKQQSSDDSIGTLTVSWRF